jgi:hypothetical protein
MEADFYPKQFIQPDFYPKQFMPQCQFASLGQPLFALISLSYLVSLSLQGSKSHLSQTLEIYSALTFRSFCFSASFLTFFLGYTLRKTNPLDTDTFVLEVCSFEACRPLH